MKLNKFMLGLLLASSCYLNAQQIEKKVLFTIDSKPFYTDEFVRVYNKNLDLVKDESQKDLGNYLDLFLGYKLKVEKALKDGLNNNITYQNELKTHRDQLAKSYLNDSEVTQKLLDEAYERYKFEVKASHILLSLDENALPSDTLKVYNKALDIRNRILKGEDFGKLAQEFSIDPSAKDNKGDLGYFSVFKMVYPFESAAYNTPIGSVSMPVRTQFGYHLIQAVDKRPNRGEVTLKHIMIVDKEGSLETSEKKIHDIHAKLVAGENFEELAKAHSNDTSSAQRGGLMPSFRSGDIAIEEFENEAFSLKNIGDYSKPFKTRLGWHIVKLENKKGVEPFDDLKFQFEGRISRDSRSQKIQMAMSEKAKSTYSYTTNKANIDALVKAIDEKKFDYAWSLEDKNPLNSKPILTINKDKVLNVKEFVNFLTLQTKYSSNIKPISKFVSTSFDKFIDTQLVAYYDEKLETRNTEFKNIVEEYKDGLLIFELLEKDIWNAAKSDSLALKQFYANNIEKYILPKRYDVEIFSTKDKKVAKKMAKLISKNQDSETIKSSLNTKDKIHVLTRKDIFEITDPALPKPIDESKKISKIIEDKEYFYIVKLNEVLPQTQLNFEDAKSRIISDYQIELESGWVNRLKNEFNIKLDQSVFNEVKNSLNNK